jgi:hypothetical protein
MRMATVGMCSKESGIERRRMFIMAPQVNSGFEQK